VTAAAAAAAAAEITLTDRNCASSLVVTTAHNIRGEKLRADDNPDVLKGRLAAYRAQTAPLAGYYAGRGMLKAVDGMAPIDDVTAAIDRILSPGGAGKPKPAKGRADRGRAKRTAKAGAKGARRKGSGRKAALAGSKRRKAAGRTKSKAGQRKGRSRRRLTKAR